MDKKYSIAIIDDEVEILNLLSRFLSRNPKFSVANYANPLAALESLNTSSYDIILLDLGLPFLSGEEVCKKIREFSNTPIIILTAKDETLTKVTLLDIGANDYITKPFIIEELLARMRVCLRKNSSENESNSNNFLAYNNIKIDLNKLNDFLNTFF